MNEQYHSALLMTSWDSLRHPWMKMIQKIVMVRRWSEISLSGAPIGWETCPLDIGKCRGCSDLSDLLTSSPQHPWLVKKLPIVAWASFHVKSVTSVPAWPSWKQLIFCLYNEALKEFVFMWWNFSDTQAFERNTESHFYMFHVTAAFFAPSKVKKDFFCQTTI